MSGTIVLFGSLHVDDRLSKLASAFDWYLRKATSLAELESQFRSAVAVFFNPEEVDSSLHRAMQLMRRAAPKAKLVVCQPFSGKESCEQLANLGAFYQLHLPFASHELHQCFGFLNAVPERESNTPRVKKKNAGSAQGQSAAAGRRS